ncbi:MAG: hypothetical protein HC875_16960 [Anaerolineales bacterium]|nr:hypothetical protein [Anaerolineales bacterium]
MTFSQYLTNYLNYTLKVRGTVDLSHTEVLAALTVSADMVLTDWESLRQINTETHLNPTQKAAIVAALRIDNPISRHTLLKHDRNHPDHLGSRALSPRLHLP